MSTIYFDARVALILAFQPLNEVGEAVLFIICPKIMQRCPGQEITVFWLSGPTVLQAVTNGFTVDYILTVLY